MEEILQKLAAAGIDLVPVTDITTHFLFTRDGFVSLVERRAEGLGNIGSAGLLTPAGLAYPVLREGKTYFVAKGFQEQATAVQLSQLRRFSEDLAQALSSK